MGRTDTSHDRVAVVLWSKSAAVRFAVAELLEDLGNYNVEEQPTTQAEFVRCVEATLPDMLVIDEDELSGSLPETLDFLQLPPRPTLLIIEEGRPLRGDHASDVGTVARPALLKKDEFARLHVRTRLNVLAARLHGSSRDQRRVEFESALARVRG